MANTQDNLKAGEVPEVPEAQVPGKYHESEESKKQASAQDSQESAASDKSGSADSSQGDKKSDKK